MSGEITAWLTLAEGGPAIFKLVFALLIGHMVADYPLQGVFLATAKNRRADAAVLFGEKQVPRGLWIHALSAHSMIHGGVVWLLTGSVVLGLAETVLHWVIDYIRCEGWIGYTTDQMLHFSCKIVYALLLAAGWVAFGHGG
jgi:hypothetical protein